MRLPLILGLVVLSALPSRADDAAPLPQDQAQEAQPGPAPQLMHLERSLMQKQDARDKGELPPEKYQQFVASFRVELDAVMARVPSNPENKGLHAQILARLGAQERGQALASLEQALADDSENPALLVAKGSILHEQKDFPAAAELARQAWEASGRKDQRAWALLKMSEGRISGARSGVPAAQLRPASDFAKLDWSIPENHDINPQALGLIRQATAARRRFDMPETWRYAQAAMNADPTSHSVQMIYEKYKADQSRHADTLTYVEQAATAIEAGRGAEGIAWAQRAYDRSPSDDTYGILQDVRRRSAEIDVKRAAEPPAKAPAPKRSSPLLPIMLIAGAGLMASGAYKIVKSKDTRTSDDGINPAPYVSPEQARRNYLNSAVLIGTPIAVAGLVFGGPIIWRAVAPTVGAALRGGQESFQRLATSEAGAINPNSISQARAAGQAAERIILGFEANGLRALSTQVGSQHLLDDPKWQETLKAAIANPATRFTISLDGFSGANAYSKLMGMAQRGLTAGARPTEWEIAQLYQAGRLGEAALLMGGQVVQNPLAQSAAR